MALGFLAWNMDHYKQTVDMLNRVIMINLLIDYCCDAVIDYCCDFENQNLPFKFFALHYLHVRAPWITVLVYLIKSKLNVKLSYKYRT